MGCRFYTWMLNGLSTNVDQSTKPKIKLSFFYTIVPRVKYRAPGVWNALKNLQVARRNSISRLECLHLVLLKLHGRRRESIFNLRWAALALDIDYVLTWSYNSWAAKD